MKRITAIVLTIVLVFSFSISSFAQIEGKDVDVKINSAYEVVKVGERITLTAAAVKHGSTFIDAWSYAENKGTNLNSETGEYISTAEFTADKPGVYTIEYNIEMKAGESGSSFSGKAVCVIKVEDALTVAGADIKDVALRELKRPDGSVSGYSAIGNVYIKWSDGTSTLYSSVFFYFGASERHKDIGVTIYNEGKAYEFMVPVEISL